ncbi:MAG: DUF11 domain-containing protein [Rhodanobacteraceae bacterium]|nr:DUF11 domain-containing protein [Rhodanobacteraceae bacterium]
MMLWVVRLRRLVIGLALLSLGMPLAAQVVTSLADNVASPPAGSLRAALNTANASGSAATITFNIAGGGTINLAGALPVLRNPNGISINGANGGQGAIVIDGGSSSATTGDRIFFLGVRGSDGSGLTATPGATWSISNLTLQDGNARGGAGGNGSSINGGWSAGGGGAGLGGAVFVNEGNATLSNVQLLTNRATGGNGGNVSAAVAEGGSGGGGGMGGNGGNGGSYNAGGGGGLGLGANGGVGSGGAGSSGLLAGATAGGAGAGTGVGAGGANGGGGGGSGANQNGGGGGPGGETATVVGPPGGAGKGGNGAFGGGGGAGGGNNTQVGGIGGYGGGGGGAGAGSGGAGGFAGGGGAGQNGGAAGFGGGSGAANYQGGGGGAGLGGAVFVRQGATLTVVGGGMSGGSVLAGSAGPSAGSGLGLGTAAFLAGNLTWTVSTGQTVTVASSQTLSGGSDPLVSGGLTKSGPGTLVLNSTSTYVGPTTVAAGQLQVNGSSVGTGAISVASGATLAGTGTLGGATSVASGGTLAPGQGAPGRLNTVNMALTAGATFAAEITGATVATQYDQLDVTGTVNLGGATLALSGAFVPGSGQSFVLIDNDASDAITGTFAGLPNGGTVLFNGVSLTISYNGGDGNDVVLTFVDPCAAYVFPYTLTGANNAARVANLRQAMQCANSNGAGADSINLNGQTLSFTDAHGDYAGATALPQVTSSMTLTGGTLTRPTGGSQFRLVNVAPAGTLNLVQLTLSNGYGFGPGGAGGGGAVFNSGTLNITDSVISSNFSELDGGAIYNDFGTISLIRSTLNGNSTNTAGGGVGGALANTGGTVVITNVLISGNRGVQGGGIYNNNAGILTLNNSTIASNLTNDQGGGLRNENSDSPAVLSNTLLFGNQSTVFPATNDIGGTTTNQSSLVGVNPSFVNPQSAAAAPNALGDYRLGNLSSAVDAGNNALIPGGTTLDRDGNPRRYNDTGVTDTGSGTAPIVDVGAFEKQTNSTLPTVSIAVTPASVLENGAGNLTYTVTRSPSLPTATTVNIGTAGTATSGGDYTGGGIATLVIPSNSSTATITIDPTGDTTVEPDETVILSVASGSGYTVGSPISATGTIQNDDADPCAAISFPYTLPDNLPATLTQAIECANANGTADIINLNGQTVTLTSSFADYTGATGLPQVTTDLTLRNGTITRSGASEFRLLSASTAATLRLTDLTLSNGGGTTYASLGGGLSSQGSLFLTGVTMSGHRSTQGGGAIAIPALQSGATVSIVDSTLSGNTSLGGSALYFSPGVSATVTLAGSTLASNVGSGGPGAIFITGTGAVINVRNSTFSGNSSGNSASPDAIGVFAAAQANIAFTTFSGHDNGTSASTVGIVHATGSSTVNLRASVIANNVRTGGGTARECTASGSTFTGTSNYAADTFCPGRVATPQFIDTTLAANGGPTQTHLPAPHSNVVNADSTNLCGPANLNLTVDQRGEPRQVGPACDVGAVEIDACGSISFPYTLPDNTPATLNAAIDCANSTAATADLIDLNGQTVTLTQSAVDAGGLTGLVSIRSPITLRNGTITRSGSNQFRLLNVNGTGNLTLRDMSLTNGGGTAYADTGGLISSDTGSTLTIVRSTLSGAVGSTASSGGAIFASGALNLVNSTVHGNSAGRGGALSAQNGPIVIANSVLSGNVATNTTSNGGGAMYLSSITANDARIINSTVTGNYATGSARTGGIAGDATSGVDLILQNSIVWGNGNAGTAAAQIVNAAASSTNTVSNSIVAGGLFGALDSDPLFTTPLTASATPSTAGNFALQNTSPAIDAGANANVPADGFDVNGNSNSTEDAPDRAGNPRRYDDTGVTDTGSGTAPIVDLGAFEKQTNSTLSQLTLTKTASAASFVVGTPVSFTLQLSNTGTAATTAASMITDPIPAGLVIGTLPAGCTAAGQTVTCTVPAGLAASGSTSFVIPVTPSVATAASITNTATVSGGGDSTCPAAARCSGSVTVAVNRPQLTLTKTASGPSFTVGTPANFTLQLSNTGTAATTAASTITDTIPAGLTIGTLPAGCAAAGQTVTCTVPAGLAASGSAGFVIPVTPGVATAASITNTATVSGGGDSTCPAAARCSSSVTVAVSGTCTGFTFPYTLAGANNAARVASLRQAIQCANLNGTADSIDLNAQTVTLSDAFADYAGATGLPQVTTEITLENGSVTRDSGAPQFRFLAVSSTGSLVLDGVNLSGGGLGNLSNAGAIYNDGGILTLRASTLSGNGAGFGGAIYNLGSVMAINSQFTGNSASQNSGFLMNDNATATIIGSTISGNSSSGVAGNGAIYNANGALDIIDSAVSGNTSTSVGAVQNFGGTTRIANSVFTGNSAASGIGAVSNNSAGQMTISNSALTGNRAGTSPGALFNNVGSTLTISNSTIAGNHATSGGAILNNGGTLTIGNSILWGNSGSSVLTGATITHTIVEGGFAGTGNLSVDPLFVAPVASASAPTTSGDYRLQDSSPATDAGNNAQVPVDTFDLNDNASTTDEAPDLAGNPRRYNDAGVPDTGLGTAPIVDMGAYERQTDTPFQADLSIAKTDGRTTDVPGTSITYTITASNAGPLAVPSATVADTFPANITGVSWTCVGAGGGSCPASGSGNLNATVNLPVGGSVSFTATGTISAAAAGTLSNTATVSSAVSDPVPGNNSATDSTTLTPQADLSITKTDGQTAAIPGSGISYTIVASNAGPSSVASATVADTFPASITGVNWTCVGAGGATCPASGSGNLNATVGLPAGGSVSFTATGTINVAATGTLSNTATVTSAVTDPTPGNNSATDTTTLSTLPQLSISDVSLSEGNSGTTQFDFIVSLSSPALAGGVSFDIATANGTATAGSDYQARSLTGQSIPAGSSDYTFSVQVNGDVVAEANETFVVNVSNVVGAGVLDGQGQGTIQNDDIAGITVNPTAGLVTTEAGGTATFTVVLNSQPTADVSIGLSSSDATEGSVAPTSLVFTSGNWNVARTVTVTGIDDLIADGTVAYTIVTAAATSADSSYNGLNATDVGVSNSDNDIVGITVSPTAGLVTTEAGGTATFTVVLNSEPTADVTIGLSSSDATEGSVAPTSLVFTAVNWNVARTVTVTGVDDLIVDGTVAYTVVTAAATSADSSYNGVNATDVGVSNSDDDTAGVILAESDGSTAVTEGGATDTYTLVLRSQPTADVTVAINPNAQLTMAPSVTFTPANWNVPRTVTVTATNDTVVEGTHSAGVSHSVTSADASYNGLSVAAVTATISDNDTAEIILASSGFSVVEGAVFSPGATLKVTANGAPGGTIAAQVVATMNLTLGTAGAADVAVSGSFVFPAGSSHDTVANSAEASVTDDRLVEATETFTLSLEIQSGLATTSASNSYSILSDDSAAITFVASTSSVGESAGTTGVPVVLAISGTGTGPAALGVDIAVSVQQTAESATTPTDYQLTTTSLSFLGGTADGDTRNIDVTVVNDGLIEGNHTFQLGFGALTTTATNASASGLHRVTLVDDDVAGVVITESAGETVVTEGGPGDSFTLELTAQPASTVTITFDVGTQVNFAPNPLVITPAQWNVPQTVTVTAVDDGASEGPHSATVGLIFTGDADFAAITPNLIGVQVAIIDRADVTVTQSGGTTAVTEGGATDTYTVVLTSQPTSDVAVILGAGAQLSLSPPNLVFTSANWNVARTVTVTATDDAVVEGPQSVAITHSTSSSDPNYSGITVAGIDVDITDNDSAVVSFALAALSQLEGSTPMAFSVTLSNPVASGVTLTLNSANGTATAADYTPISGATVSFPASSTTAQTVNVAIASDALDEDDETYTLTLSGLTATGDVTLGTAVAPAPSSTMTPRRRCRSPARASLKAMPAPAR